MGQGFWLIGAQQMRAGDHGPAHAGCLLHHMPAQEMGARVGPTALSWLSAAPRAAARAGALRRAPYWLQTVCMHER
jgi:hypothetical protein